MSKLILTLLLLTIIGVKAQVPKIHFDYDDFGNQIRRELCANCPLRISNQPQKEISEIKQEDLQKFSSQDVISYYPNPVKEELYLKWDLIKNNTVNQI